MSSINVNSDVAEFSYLGSIANGIEKEAQHKVIQAQWLHAVAELTFNLLGYIPVIRGFCSASRTIYGLAQVIMGLAQVAIGHTNDKKVDQDFVYCIQGIGNILRGILETFSYSALTHTFWTVNDLLSHKFKYGQERDVADKLKSKFQKEHPTAGTLLTILNTDAVFFSVAGLSK